MDPTNMPSDRDPTKSAAGSGAGGSGQGGPNLTGGNQQQQIQNQYTSTVNNSTVALVAGHGGHNANINNYGSSSSQNKLKSAQEIQTLQRLHEEVERTTRKLEFARRRLLKTQDDIKKASEEYGELIRPKRVLQNQDQNNASGTCLPQLGNQPQGSQYSPYSRSKYGNKNKSTKNSMMMDPKTAEKHRKARLRMDTLAKQVSVSRLSETLQRLDTMTHQNQELRHMIEEVRRERLQGNLVFKKLSEKLRQTAVSNNDLSQQRERTYNDYQEGQQEIRNLKKKNERERRLFDIKIRKLQSDLQFREKEKKEIEVKLFKARKLLEKEEEMRAEQELQEEKRQQQQLALMNQKDQYDFDSDQSLSVSSPGPGGTGKSKGITSGSSPTKSSNQKSPTSGPNVNTSSPKSGSKTITTGAASAGSALKKATNFNLQNSASKEASAAVAEGGAVSGRTTSKDINQTGGESGAATKESEAASNDATMNVDKVKSQTDVINPRASNNEGGAESKTGTVSGVATKSSLVTIDPALANSSASGNTQTGTTPILNKHSSINNQSSILSVNTMTNSASMGGGPGSTMSQEINTNQQETPSAAHQQQYPKTPRAKSPTSPTSPTTPHGSHFKQQKYDQYYLELANTSTTYISNKAASMDERRLKKEILRLSFCNLIQRRHIKMHRRKVEQFEDAFRTIKSNTQVTDLEDIIRTFARLEERNYSLVVYINLLSLDIQAHLRRNGLVNHQYRQSRESEEGFGRQMQTLGKDFRKLVGSTKEYLSNALGDIVEHRRLLDKISPLIISITNNLTNQNRILLTATGISNRELEEARSLCLQNQISPHQKLAGGPVLQNPLALLHIINKDDLSNYGELNLGGGPNQNVNNPGPNNTGAAVGGQTGPGAAQGNTGPNSNPNQTGQNQNLPNQPGGPTMPNTNGPNINTPNNNLNPQPQSILNTGVSSSSSLVTNSGNADQIFEYLTFIEKVLSQWCEFLPVMSFGDKGGSSLSERPFPSTIGSVVKQLPIKKGVMLGVGGGPNNTGTGASDKTSSQSQSAGHGANAYIQQPLIKTADLPTANILASLDDSNYKGYNKSAGGGPGSGQAGGQGGNTGTGGSGGGNTGTSKSGHKSDHFQDDDDSDEADHVMSMSELRARAVQVLSKRAKRRGQKGIGAGTTSNIWDTINQGNNKANSNLKANLRNRLQGGKSGAGGSGSDKNDDSPSMKDKLKGPNSNSADDIIIDDLSDKDDIGGKSDGNYGGRVGGLGKKKGGTDGKDGGKSSGDGKDKITGILTKDTKDDIDDNSSDSGTNSDAGHVTAQQINEIFLEKYRMSKDELQSLANTMGIALSNLCYLKQEFDLYDSDNSGYIDLNELRELLEKLGESLTEEEMTQAFAELDSDSSGEIEFSEFVEWFTKDE